MGGVTFYFADTSAVNKSFRPSVMPFQSIPVLRNFAHGVGQGGPSRTGSMRHHQRELGPNDRKGLEVRRGDAMHPLATLEPWLAGSFLPTCAGGPTLSAAHTHTHTTITATHTENPHSHTTLMNPRLLTV